MNNLQVTFTILLRAYQRKFGKKDDIQKKLPNLTILSRSPRDQKRGGIS